MIWNLGRPKNRQNTRRHVLNVRLSSEQRQGARLRWLGVAFGTAASAFLVLFLCWRGGDWALQKWIYRNPAFAVREIEVDTDGVIAPEQLRRWAGVNLEENLFGVDLARIKRDLEYVPVVRSAEVERLLPHTLRIRVIEREPVAQFVFAQPRLGGAMDVVTYTLDEEGFVMPQIPAYQRATPPATNEWLPTITGVPPAEIRPGRRVESIQVLAALRMVVAFERSPMAGLVDLREVFVGSADVLLVNTEQRSQIVMGLRNPEQQLQRWRGIFEYGQRRSLHIAVADLSVSNNVPTRWLEAGEAALVKPKAARILRSKKRNA
ncbi:MAG: FtsQ-type POTRA domain-containing protein [Verrucomicrobia bacterium]|nr:FtsQ-type POTRA domain-containing protein [Verrucomicrobiota bacterium]